MRFTFLGTGTSGGVPALGCHCAVCESTDPHDKRLRTAGLLETEDTRILIDCGPDIRQQLMPMEFNQIDGVLLTHVHYDHVAGIDDLRPFCVYGPIGIYADQHTGDRLHQSMPYCFGDHLYPGVPLLDLKTIEPHHPIMVGHVEVMPIQVMHALLPILGFRIGKMAYITDMRTINDTELPYLEGVETLVVNALRFKPLHYSHMTVDEAIAFSRKIGVRHTYLVHMSHDVGLHKVVNNEILPEGFEWAYDGLQIDV